MGSIRTSHIPSRSLRRHSVKDAILGLKKNTKELDKLQLFSTFVVAESKTSEAGVCSCSPAARSENITGNVGKVLHLIQDQRQDVD